MKVSDLAAFFGNTDSIAQSGDEEEGDAEGGESVKRQEEGEEQGDPEGEGEGSEDESDEGDGEAANGEGEGEGGVISTQFRWCGDGPADALESVLSEGKKRKNFEKTKLLNDFLSA